jgi:hypothetical protein
MKPSIHVAVMFVLALSNACGGVRAPIDAPKTTAPVTELWQAPNDIASRNLYWGAGGEANAPDPNGTFTFVSAKTTGTNPGYDAKDQKGRLWSIKIGYEAQPEIVSSRVLWAIGFHQPAEYYLPKWNLTGGSAPGPQQESRFRLEGEDAANAGEWAWHDNPFVGTPPFRGLIVAQIILNNWDLKTENNKIYQDAGGGRRFMVRDLGASLGEAKQQKLFKLLGIRNNQGTKNDLEGFERQGFFERGSDGKVKFAYDGIQEPLFNSVSSADIVWTCQWLSKLSDAQWNDAFRAAGYDDAKRARYIAKLKAKIAQGLTLAATRP